MHALALALNLNPPDLLSLVGSSTEEGAKPDVFKSENTNLCLFHYYDKLMSYKTPQVTSFLFLSSLVVSLSSYSFFFLSLFIILLFINLNYLFPLLSFFLSFFLSSSLAMHGAPRSRVTDSLTQVSSFSFLLFFFFCLVFYLSFILLSFLFISNLN